MSDLQEQIKDVCRLADAVIKDPKTPVSISATNIGVCAPVAGIIEGGDIVFAPLTNFVIGVIKTIFGQKEQQEKERMLREVIRKQQAVIRKLEAELAKSRQQNAQNRLEIEHLKEMLRVLEKTEQHLNAA